MKVVWCGQCSQAAWLDTSVAASPLLFLNSVYCHRCLLDTCQDPRESSIIVGRNVQIFDATASRGQSQLLTLSAAEIRMLVRRSYLTRGEDLGKYSEFFPIWAIHQSLDILFLLSNKSTMSKRLKSVSFMISWFKSGRRFATVPHYSLTRSLVPNVTLVSFSSLSHVKVDCSPKVSQHRIWDSPVSRSKLSGKWTGQLLRTELVMSYEWGGHPFTSLVTLLP